MLSANGFLALLRNWTEKPSLLPSTRTHFWPTTGYQLKLFGTNLKLFLRKIPLVKGQSMPLTSAAPPSELLPVKLPLKLSLPQAKKRAFPWTPSIAVSKTLALIMSACCPQKIKLALPHFGNCTANKFRTQLNLLLSSTPTC